MQSARILRHSRSLKAEKRNSEFDRVDLEQSEEVFIERRQGKLRNQVEAPCDAVGVGYDLVIGCGELRASGARTGVGVDGGFLEQRVGRNVEREQRGSETASADGERGDRPREIQAGQ